MIQTDSDMIFPCFDHEDYFQTLVQNNLGLGNRSCITQEFQFAASSQRYTTTRILYPSVIIHDWCHILKEHYFCVDQLSMQI